MIKIANYLLSHYKGTYRILCDACPDTNDFPRKIDGTYEDIDCYIICDKDIRIYSYGHGILQAYVPSLRQGRNIIRFIYRDLINENNTQTNIIHNTITNRGKEIDTTKENISIINDELFQQELKNNNIIFNIEETDEEILFKFKAKDFDRLSKYLCPRTHGANISPFSNKNRPKTKYKIPDEDQLAYKKIIQNLPQNQLVLLAHITNSYLKSLVNKNNSWEDIKADVRLKGLKSKEYIHSIGHWQQYLKYMEKELCQN